MGIDQLIDLKILKSLFDAFYAATGITASIISTDGQILTRSRWRKICTDFHRRHPASNRFCIQSDTRVNRRLLEGQGPLVYQCPHGLIDAATPIIVDKVHMANLFIGQFFFDPLDAETIARFRKQAAQWDFDEKTYVEALLDVPIIPNAHIDPILEYLKQLAELIAEMGLSRLKQRESEAAMARTHAALKQEVAQREQDAKQLTEILGGNPMPTFVIDAAGMVTHWNRACELLTGVTASAVIGTDKHRSIFYPEPRDLLADILVKNGSINELAMLYGNRSRSARQTAEGFEGEDFFPRLGDKGKWLFFNAAPLRDVNGDIVGAIETIQDVTARNLAEQGIRASESRYRQLFESANDAIFILKERILIDCNQKALELFGCARDEMIGMSPLVFSPERQPDGMLSTAAILKREAMVIQTGPQFFEWRFIHKNGSPFDAEVSLTRFDIDNTPHTMAIVRDVTDRNRMIQTLRKREKELDEKSRYLERVNQALKASLDHREVEKRAVEENILVNLKRFVFPYLEDLGKCSINVEAKAYLNIIDTNLHDIISQFSETIFSKYIDFTPTEVRVADLIRKGRNTKEIAELLDLSPSSIQWHRKNIREKLGLTNKKINLYTYLNSQRQ